MRGKKPLIPARQVGLAELDRIWVAIRGRREAWLSSSIAAEAEADLGTAQRYALSLYRAEIASRERGDRRTWRYQLARDPGQVRPRLTASGALQPRAVAAQAMWTAAGVMKRGSVEELAAAAGVTCTEARTALHWWSRPGLFALEVQRGVICRWRLVERPGPLAPEWGRVAQVYCPNFGEIIWQEAPRG